MRKNFCIITALRKYIEILVFRVSQLVVQINMLDHYKQFSLQLSAIYVKVARRFLNVKLWKTANWTYI